MIFGEILLPQGNNQSSMTYIYKYRRKIRNQDRRVHRFRKSLLRTAARTMASHRDHMRGTTRVLFHVILRLHSRAAGAGVEGSPCRSLNVLETPPVVRVYITQPTACTEKITLRSMHRMCSVFQRRYILTTRSIYTEPQVCCNGIGRKTEHLRS